MFERINRSWALTKSSFAILKQDKTLALFPILSSIATVLVVISLFVPVAMMSDKLSGMSDGAANVLGLVGLFTFYFCTSVVVLFFQVATLHCVRTRFMGLQPTLSDGIKAAMTHMPAIISWSFLGGLVGVVLAQIEQRFGFVGTIIRRMLGGAWAILSFFALPIMIYEDKGAWEATKRSKEIISKTWGEALSAHLGFSWVSSSLAFLGIFGFFLSIPLAASAGNNGGMVLAIAGVVTLLYLIALTVIFSTLTQIFRGALYHYATTNEVPAFYSEELINGAFSPVK